MVDGDSSKPEWTSGSPEQPPTRIAPVACWSSRTAWRCIVALVIAEFMMSLSVRLAFSGAGGTAWLDAHRYSLQTAIKVLRFVLWLSIAYAFSREHSPVRWALSLGLGHPPTTGGWWCGSVALGISLLDYYGGARGLTSPNPVAHGFYQRGGGLLLFYVLYVVSVGPFFEEVVLRGFLYRAFRQSYGRLSSTAAVLGVGAYFHWAQLTHSFWTPVCLILLWMLLCMVMEWTGNIWNCILGHAIYNAAQVLKWPIYVGAVLLFLMLCAKFSGSASPRRKSCSEAGCTWRRLDKMGW